MTSGWEYFAVPPLENNEIEYQQEDTLNKKTSALLVGAMISGLVAGNAAYADKKANKKAAAGTEAAADHKCKGEKCTPEEKAKHEKAAGEHHEGAEHTCNEGCGGKDKKKK